MRESAIKFLVGAFVALTIVCIPAGIALWLYTEDARWLWLCAALILYLS